ncbi:MAG: PAS domain S-box protein [Myxococcales bacterium]|nr:PAS domain S-box protein [Myxococcales bacterium]
MDPELELDAVVPAIGRALEAVGARVSARGDEVSVTLEPDASVEAELRRSEARFRALVEAIPEPVFITGLGGISYGNPAAVRLFGYDNLEEALGKDPRSVAHPDDVAQLEQRAMAMLLERRTLPPFEYRVYRRDGELLTIEVSSIPIEYEGVPSILTFARDATERKQVEAALLQADRLAVLGLLAGGLAHAMNNPLSYVLVDLEQAERAIAAGLGSEAECEEVLKRLREAHEGAQRIADVVRRMRSLSRIDDDRRTPVDVRAVLEAALELIGNELRHKGQLSIELEDAPPVMASRGRLEQVFLNLLAHAAQSLPETGEGRVELVMRGDAEHVVVEVFDDVLCREPRDMARMLEPFPTPKEGLRRALSLPLCRSVVEGLGGEMSVDDTDRGMRVRIVLPAAASLGSVTLPVRGSSNPAPRPEATAAVRLLVIDADAAVGSALRLMLEPDHSITCVRKAREANEELLSGDQFDLVLCDATQASVGAEELVETLSRERPELLARVVLMTGGAPDERQRGLIQRVAGRHLDKPFDAERVRGLISARKLH